MELRKNGTGVWEGIALWFLGEGDGMQCVMLGGGRRVETAGVGVEGVLVEVD